MIVVDSSVAFKWLVDEVDSDRAADLLGGDLVSPDLVLAECGNALWTLIARGMLDEGHALAGLATLPTFVRILPAAEFSFRALTIAAGLRHPVYDCYFLALAEHLDCKLITADARLIAGCNASPFRTIVQRLA